MVSELFDEITLSLIQIHYYPIASLFFVSYEATKRLLGASVDPKHSHFVHMAAASFGEIVSKWHRMDIKE